MFAWLRSVAIVGVIAYWSPTHGGDAVRRGLQPSAARLLEGAVTPLATGLRWGVISPARLADLHRAGREAEPPRRVLADPPSAEATPDPRAARSGVVRQVYPLGAGPPGEAGLPGPSR